MDKTLHTFGFTATQTAQNFVAELVHSLRCAAEAGFVPAQVPAYAVAGQKRGIIRD